jgi:hypothetical protein
MTAAKPSCETEYICQQVETTAFDPESKTFEFRNRFQGV